MRGKDFSIVKPENVIRITPAYAGKRELEDLSTVVKKDHPRLCGEKNQTTGNERRLVGSPPPMRGKD